MGVTDVIALRRLTGARTRVTAFNGRLADRITRTVGTMACAYVFSVLGGMGVAAALTDNTAVVLIVGSISGYFLQLVLLPVIMVGQNRQGQASDARAEDTRRVILDTHDQANKTRTELVALVRELHAEVVPGSEHAP